MRQDNPWIVMAAFVSVVIALILVVASVEGIEKIRVDTLIDFQRAPASAWLDSVARADSLKTINNEVDK